MTELEKLFRQYVTPELIGAVLSNPRRKESGRKIQIRPVQLKTGLVFQASEYRGTQVFHHNLKQHEAAAWMCEWMTEYRQAELTASFGQAWALVSKKGKVTIKEKNGCKGVKPADLSHNRKKRYILQPRLNMTNFGRSTAFWNSLPTSCRICQRIGRFRCWILAAVNRI